MKLTSALNLNQTTEELNTLYGDQDYYWYLRSKEFDLAFYQRLGYLVNECGTHGACLDVACGEGQLYPNVKIPYLGFDGSHNAVRRAAAYDPPRPVIYGRIETPEKIPRAWFSVVVFAGVLEVLIKPEARLPLLERYQSQFDPAYFIICDLERLDLEPIIRRYPLQLQESCTSVAMDNLEDVKRHRKLTVVKC